MCLLIENKSTIIIVVLKNNKNIFITCVIIDILIENEIINN